ncbi:MAG: DUF4062 domain-containing protein [Anaerolineae bacterium]|nr:DUF4062 domain-containing protein [Anaerolineae bacterium]
MNTEEKIKNIREVLDKYERQRHRLNMQIASHGGEASAPIGMLDQRDEISTTIQKLEAELQNLQEQAANSLPRQPLTPHLSTVDKATLPPIRVFVSSTIKDLQPERDVVARALQSLDLEVVRAENIGSQSASPYEVSLMMEQQCDIYLGIYGGRYGSIVPGDGRSITEIEYHTAREKEKPILLYRKIGVDVEPEQAEFLAFVGNMKQGHTWREFDAGDVPGQLMVWVQTDVRAEVQRHPEWATRRPTRERVLLASLGRSPGAVTGLYHALARANNVATRVVTFSPAHRDVRDAAGICSDEFRKLGVPYANHFMDAEDIESEANAYEFKGMFVSLLEHLAPEAEVLVGITGGRTVMGALMAIVVQTTAPENVALYHLDVDDAIEAEGRLPELWRFEGTERWEELLAPSSDLCHLVQVPYVKFPTREN